MTTSSRGTRGPARIPTATSIACDGRGTTPSPEPLAVGGGWAGISPARLSSVRWSGGQPQSQGIAPREGHGTGARGTQATRIEAAQRQQLYAHLCPSVPTAACRCLPSTSLDTLERRLSGPSSIPIVRRQYPPRFRCLWSLVEHTRRPQPDRRRELVQQVPCFPQISGFEALGEPSEDRLEQLPRFGRPSLLVPQPAEAQARAQLPPLRVLLACAVDRLPEPRFGRIVPFESAEHLATYPVDLGLRDSFTCGLEPSFNRKNAMLQ